MCVRLRGNKMKPGDMFGFKTLYGTGAGKWGLFNSTQANARVERLDGLWKDYKRGIIYSESFWESGVEFKRAGSKDFVIGIIYNPKYEFAVVTCDSIGVVKLIHDRMPLLLTNDSIIPYFNKQEVHLIPGNEIMTVLKLVA